MILEHPIGIRSASRFYAFTLLSSFSFVVMLKDDLELEYPQCEIRARQHWYPIPNYDCLSLYCKGCDIVVILV